MATRMQQRRGTSSQWTAANPVLAAGEIGFETDTSKFKMGNGTSTWSELVFFANATELVAAIDSVVGMAPETLNTLSEISDALGDNPDFLSLYATNDRLDTTILTGASQVVSAIQDHRATTTSIHGIADTSVLATATTVATAKSEAISTASSDATTKANAAQAAAEATAAAAVAALTKSSVGLSNVDNTADAFKPVSSAQEYAIATAKTEAITAAGQIADTNLSDHNSDTTNVHGIADMSALALTATVNSGLALKAPLASPTFTGTVVGISKSMVGLGNVDNTSDSAKPVSTATQTALDLKASLASPELTGTPTAPTASAGTATTQVATTAFVGTAVSNLVASAPAALDTLNELATALGNDANFSTTLTNNLSAKAPLASPALTGTATVVNLTASGTVTLPAAGIVFTDGTQSKAGVPSITSFATSISASATIGADLADKFVPLAGGVTITLPATGYSTGQSIDFYQESGTGAQFALNTTVVGTPGLKFRTTNSVATAMKTSSGWLVFGDLSA